MSWGLAADWLGVAGTALLTFGTGTQAWANLTEFMSLRRSLPWDALDAGLGVDRERWLAIVRFFYSRGDPGSDSRWVRFQLRIVLALAIVVSYRRVVARLGAKGDVAVQLAQFLRLTTIWGILMVGSALALVAAAIQLAIAYQ